MDVPATLRRWFTVHAALHALVGVPLWLWPGVLAAVGAPPVDGATGRLAGAALVAIGAHSYLTRNGTLEVVRPVLTLNLVWSFAAALGLFLAVGDGAPPAAWALMSGSIAFCGIWAHYRIRMKQMARAADLPEDDGE